VYYTPKSYFGAILRRKRPRIKNKILGIQTAIRGDKLPAVAKTVDICINKIKAKLIAIPKPKCIPTPPLVFRLERETPIIVKIIVAKGNDTLLYFSTS